MKPPVLQISQSNRGPSTHHMQAVTMTIILISRPSSLFKGANSHSSSEFAFKPLLFHLLLQPCKNKLLLLMEGFPFWLQSILSSTLFQSFEKTLRYCTWTGKLRKKCTLAIYIRIFIQNWVRLNLPFVPRQALCSSESYYSPGHAGTFQSSREASIAKQLLQMIENRRGNIKKLKFLVCPWHPLHIHHIRCFF